MKHSLCLAILLFLSIGCTQTMGEPVVVPLGTVDILPFYTPKNIPFTPFAFTPDGKRLVLASKPSRESTDCQVQIWVSATGTRVQSILLQGLPPEAEHPYVETSFYLIQNGDKIVTVNDAHNGAGKRKRTLRVWDTESGKELSKIETDTGTFHSFSPDGKMFVTDNGRSVQIWNTESGEELQRLVGHNNRITSVVFAPGGKKLVTASRDGTAGIWDVESGKELHNLQGHTNIFSGDFDPIRSIQFSSDGKKIVTAGYDNIVKVWDAETGKELQKWEYKWARGESAFPIISSVTFSPDGKKLVIAYVDRTVRICDIESGRELRKLAMPSTMSHPAVHAVFSPDGKKLITVCYGSPAILWDAESGRELQRIKAPSGFPVYTDSFIHAVFSPNGKSIAVVSERGYAALWIVEP